MINWASIKKLVGFLNKNKRSAHGLDHLLHKPNITFIFLFFFIFYPTTLTPTNIMRMNRNQQ